MTTSRSVLAFNSGSSSIKFAVYRMDGAEEPLLKGKAERIGLDASTFHAYDAAGKEAANERRPLPDHEAAIERVLACVRDAVPVPLNAVGHRLVRGGVDDKGPELLTDGLMGRLRELVPYLPEHLPHQLRAIEAVAKYDSRLMQVICFDTAFHRRMPRIAQLYALPRSYSDDGILRLGFHGLSYEYVIGELAKEAGGEVAKGRVVIAHLGNGCSMAAIREGRSLDTTMGFTPTSGLMMSSRSGDLDPEIILYLLEQRHLTPAAVSDIINQKAGLAGVSGGSSDMRDLLTRAATEEHAAEAVELFCYLAKKFLGALAAVLGGLDVLVFTAGIGENAPEVRRKICEGLGHLGLFIDAQRNGANAPVISTPESAASVRVIPTNEELMIARHTISLLSQ